MSASRWQHRLKQMECLGLILGESRRHAGANLWRADHRGSPGAGARGRGRDLPACRIAAAPNSPCPPSTDRRPASDGRTSPDRNARGPIRERLGQGEISRISRSRPAISHRRAKCYPAGGEPQARTAAYACRPRSRSPPLPIHSTRSKITCAGRSSRCRSQQVRMSKLRRTSAAPSNALWIQLWTIACSLQPSRCSMVSSLSVPKIRIRSSSNDKKNGMPGSPCGQSGCAAGYDPPASCRRCPARTARPPPAPFFSRATGRGSHRGSRSP